MSKAIFIFWTLVFPVISFAQDRQRGVKEVLVAFGKLVDWFIPGGAIFALIYFFYAMAMFIKNAGNEEGREEGKLRMKWGIISLFVILSIWGIVTFLKSELALPNSPDNIIIPNF